MGFQETTTVAHPPAEVFGTLVDEDFNHSITRGVGGELVAFERQGELTGPVSVTLVRTVPVSKLPEPVQKFAGKFLGEHLRMEQTETWSAPAADGSRTGRVVITVAAVKVTATAEQQLVPADGGSTEVRVTGAVECRIPLVGGKVAQTAEPRVGRVLNRQAREVTAWLDKR